MQFAKNPRSAKLTFEISIFDTQKFNSIFESFFKTQYKSLEGFISFQKGVKAKILFCNFNPFCNENCVEIKEVTAIYYFGEFSRHNEQLITTFHFSNCSVII